MDVGHVKGSGGVERGADRPSRREPQRHSDSAQDGKDTAAISESGRETAAIVEGLAAKARRDEPDRQDRVDAAQARLQQGALDQPDVIRDTARRILGQV